MPNVISLFNHCCTIWHSNLNWIPHTWSYNQGPLLPKCQTVWVKIQHQCCHSHIIETLQIIWNSLSSRAVPKNKNVVFHNFCWSMLSSNFLNMQNIQHNYIQIHDRQNIVVLQDFTEENKAKSRKPTVKIPNLISKVFYMSVISFQFKISAKGELVRAMTRTWKLGYQIGNFRLSITQRRHAHQVRFFRLHWIPQFLKRYSESVYSQGPPEQWVPAELWKPDYIVVSMELRKST